MYLLGMLERILVFLALISLSSCDDGTTTSTQYVTESCITKSGPSSLKIVPTTSYLFTTSQYLFTTTTFTPTVTRYLTVATATTVSTVFQTKTTTAAPNTGFSTVVATSYTINYVTITKYITQTTSVTATSEITAPGGASTITIPTSPGFIPIQSGIYVKKRDAIPEITGAPKMKRAAAASYPTTVSCGRLIDFITYQVRTVATANPTIVAAPTTTYTRVNYYTSTIISTYTPPATRKTTSTTVVTLSRTTEVPGTTTITSTSFTTKTVGPVETFYAACDTNNFRNTSSPGDPPVIDPLGEAYLINNYPPYDNPEGRVVDGPTSAYECCVACMKTPNCGGGFFEYGTCTISQPTKQCLPGDFNVQVGYLSPGDDAISTVFNGPCGQVVST